MKKIQNLKWALFQKITNAQLATDYTGILITYPPTFIWDTVTHDNFIKEYIPMIFSKKFYSVYIHIPFCKKKCLFCKQYSLVGQDESMYSRYEEAIIREIILYSKFLKDKEIIHLYLGGGTPTLLNLAKIVKALKDYFITSSRFTIDVEATLDSLTKDKLLNLKEAGITRLLIGIQSFDKKVLAQVDKDPQDAVYFKDIINFCKRIGIPYINIELIAGLPHQTAKSFLNDIKTLINSRVDSLHYYPLLITPLTVLWKDKKKQHSVASSRSLTKMLLKAENMLKNSGFKREGFDFCRDIGAGNRMFDLTQALRNYGGMLGLGITSLSRYYHNDANGNNRVFHFMNTLSLDEYYCKINQSLFPVEKQYVLGDNEEVLRMCLMRRLGYGRLDFLRFFNDLKNMAGIELGLEKLKIIFAKELEFLKEVGKVEYDPNEGVIKLTGIPWAIYSKVFFSRKVLLECIRKMKHLKELSL